MEKYWANIPLHEWKTANRSWFRMVLGESGILDEEGIDEEAILDGIEIVEGSHID